MSFAQLGHVKLSIFSGILLLTVLPCSMNGNVPIRLISGGFLSIEVRLPFLQSRYGQRAFNHRLALYCRSSEDVKMQVVHSSL